MFFSCEYHKVVKLGQWRLLIKGMFVNPQGYIRVYTQSIFTRTCSEIINLEGEREKERIIDLLVILTSKSSSSSGTIQ